MLTSAKRSDRPAQAPARSDEARQGDVLTVLARMEAKQDHILRLLVEGRRARTPDRDRDARLLSGLAATFGGAVFSARDVLAAAGELHELVAGMGRRALGTWLRALHRSPIPPYRLRAVKRNDAGTVWAVAVDGGDRHAPYCCDGPTGGD